MKQEYLKYSDILGVKKAGEVHGVFQPLQNSKENGASYEPSPPVPECSGCMQDRTGIWVSLYDPVNLPLTEKHTALEHTLQGLIFLISLPQRLPGQTSVLHMRLHRPPHKASAGPRLYAVPSLHSP